MVVLWCDDMEVMRNNERVNVMTDYFGFVLLDGLLGSSDERM